MASGRARVAAIALAILALCILVYALFAPAAPAWTDFNTSDPSITLVELFAFVAVGLFAIVSSPLLALSLLWLALLLAPVP